MAYPNPPEIATNYSGVEQALGDGSLPGQELDVDLAAVRASATAVIEFLKGITRSDGKLANGIVTTESLASSVIAGFDTPVVWATGQNYTPASLVFEGARLYIGLAVHTSTVFSTDLASGRWSLLADLTPPGTALVATNNLSDVQNAGNARANLGLGSMSTASSGTGAAQHRTNIQNDAVYQAILTGLTASVAELNKLAGSTPTTAEINRLSGVTSAIQTQINAKQAEVLTTNGDLVARIGGATARLPLGAAGTALVSNGSDAVYRAGSRILIVEKTASASATLDFTEFNNAVYRYYEFELEYVKPATNAVDLAMRFSSNGGSTYDAGGTDYSWSALAANSAAPNAQAVQGTATALNLCYGGHLSNAGADQGMTGTVRLYGAANTGNGTRHISTLSTDGTVNLNTLFHTQGKRRLDQDTDALRFFMSSGNIASGVIRMYGLV